MCKATDQKIFHDKRNINNFQFIIKIITTLEEIGEDFAV